MPQFYLTFFQGLVKKYLVIGLFSTSIGKRLLLLEPFDVSGQKSFFQVAVSGEI